MNDVTFSFDGQPIRCDEGMTVGAALVASGVRSWRTTRVGQRPRGIFCAIGVCFDCLITVNGQPSVRACLATARGGDEVRSQVGTGHGDAG